MAQPPAYVPAYSFTDHSTSQPSTPQPGDKLDAEYDAIRDTTDALRANLALIQRDDGLLANGSVHVDALTPTAIAVLSDWNPRGAWLTATAYAAKDLVTLGGQSYICVTAHTSGTFATDLAAGKWLVVTQDGLLRDGTNAPTADLIMGGFKHTGVNTLVTARNQYAPVALLQDGKAVFVVAGGTADALTATFAPAFTGLVEGCEVHVRAIAANATTTPTFAPNGLTARTIAKLGGAALAIGDIVGAGHELSLRYNALTTKWELLNPGASISLDADLVAIAAIAGTGLIARTGAGTAAARTIVATSLGGLAVTNGDGVAGDPALALDASNLTVEPAPVSTDYVPFYDVSVPGMRRASVSAILAAASPGITGEIRLWPTATAPTGWLKCDGSAVSRVTYAVLFNLIGTTFGVGDGSTTFNLPDSRGRAIVGAGAGPSLTSRTVGQSGGEETHVLTPAEIPAHTHTFPGSVTDGGGGGGNSYPKLGAGGNVATTSSIGSGNAHNNMQPYLVLQYIIKT